MEQTTSLVTQQMVPVSGGGGAILAVMNTMVRFSGVSNFSHNSADVGGAIFTYINVVLTFNGMNNFINNSANNYGSGAIYATNSILLPSGEPMSLWVIQQAMKVVVRLL